MHFGEWLKDQRKALKFTQSQLAELVTASGARTPQNTVSAWERGKAEPTLRQSIALYRVILGDRDTMDALILPLQPKGKDK